MARIRSSGVDRKMMGPSLRNSKIDCQRSRRAGLVSIASAVTRHFLRSVDSLQRDSA